MCGVAEVTTQYLARNNLSTLQDLMKSVEYLVDLDHELREELKEANIASSRRSRF